MSNLESAQSMVGPERSGQIFDMAGSETADPPELRSMVSTAELSRPPSRPPDYAAENQALIALAQMMATSPDTILHKLDASGLRTRVMEAMIRDQLKGEMRFEWRMEGLECEIALPG